MYESIGRACFAPFFALGGGVLFRNPAVAVCKRAAAGDALPIRLSYFLPLETMLLVHKRGDLYEFVQRKICELKVRIVGIDQSDDMALRDLPPDCTHVRLQIPVERDDTQAPQRQILPELVFEFARGVAL